MSLVLVLLSLCLLAGAAELPGNIKACKNDAKLNECVVKASKDAIKNLVKGDPKLRIPVLDPLYIEKIQVTDGPGKPLTLNITLEKLNIHGFANSEFLKSEIDTKKMSVKWSFKTKELKLHSDYELSGKFLLLPITGKGKCTIVLYEPTFEYTFDYKLEERKGQKYAVIGKPKLTYNPKKISLNFENLFNGDKLLGENMNQVLNDNWRELNKELGPWIANAILIPLHNILLSIAKNIPYNQIFL